MTKTYLMLEVAMNLDGLMFPAGPRMSMDDAWTRKLLVAGALEITEEQFKTYMAEVLAPATAPAVEVEVEVVAEAEAPAPATGDESGDGAHDTDDGRGDQSTDANFVRRPRPRRHNRRV